MRCVTRNDAAQNWIESNNLCTVILGILLNIKKIWWAAKCRLCEKVGNLTFALSANWLWLSSFVCCANFRLFGGLVSVSAVTYWRVFSGYVLLPWKCRTTCVSWFGAYCWVSKRYDQSPNAGYVKKWVTWLLLYLLTGCESILSSVVSISGCSVVW